MTLQCCKCKCVKGKESWTQPAAEIKEAVSFTYCPDCFKESVEEMRYEGARLAGLALAN